MVPEEAVMNYSSKPTSYDKSWIGGWPQTRREFEAFVDAFLDRLVRAALYRLGNMEEAQDIVQDVFVKAYADREKLRRVRQVGPYLYRMTANACAEHRRKRKVLSLEDIGSEDIPDGPDEVSQQIAAVEELQRINQYLSCLPPAQAEVIRLQILDGFSLAEIALIIGRGLPTVKARFRYGLRKLRRIVPHSREESE